MFNCTAESENVSHIAESLGLKQPTVHKSVQSLIENYYLEYEQKYKHGEKRLMATHKGAAAAVVLGADYNHLKDYINRRKPDDRGPFDIFEKSLASAPRREVIIRRAMEHALKNDFFDGGGFKRLTEQELKDLQRFIIIETLKYSRESSKTQKSANTIREFVDRYGIDKEFVKSCVARYQLTLEAIMRELDKK